MAFLTESYRDYRDSYLLALREFQAEGRHLHLDVGQIAAHFDAFARDLRERKLHPRPDKVAETILWLVEGDEFIGRLSLRHRLTASLLAFGGHIGYEIRPSRRRRGYGTLILRLGLERSRQIGLRRVLMTCDETNIASAKIIETNGGVLENTLLVTGRDVPTRRYWITLAPA